jgi:hypothetical protein
MRIKKSLWITIAVIITVIIFAVTMKSTIGNGVSSETAKCIAKNSLLYVQLGCHACENQEKLFGDTFQYLNVVDCFYEREKCSEVEIQYTPTWIINGQKYVGIQKIEELKQITGC